MNLVHTSLSGILDSLNLNPREMKTQALATLIDYYTGSRPVIDRYEGYNDILLTKEQAKLLQGKIDDLASSAPGDVRFNVKPVIIPYVIKKYGVYALGVMAAGFILGRMSK